MTNPILFLVLGAVVLQAGCTLAPAYVRPAAPVPAELPAVSAAARDAGTAGSGLTAIPRWQEFFADTKLQQVIQNALDQNRDLRLAALTVDRARALYNVQRAEMQPSLSAVGSGNRARVPADLSSTGLRHTTHQYSVNLGVTSWEIDFFGRLRNLKTSALEEYLASEEARRSARILLVSSTATAYLSLAGDRESLALAQTTLENQKRVYDLVKRQVDRGLAAELDLRRAQTQVDAATADVARLTQVTALDTNALNLLVGAPVSADLLAATLADVASPGVLRPGLSSDVLLLRPDVQQAEHLLRAAHADIGAARATFFPRISLTATVGTASADLTGLFKSGSGTWAYAPQVAMPVFDGRTWAAYRVTKVQREMAVTRYEKAIQGAFREVADALAREGTVEAQVAAQESLVQAVTETYRLATVRYEKGIDSYLSVLDAQRSLYAAQQGLVSLRLARVASRVQLYGALGGGDLHP